MSIKLLLFGLVICYGLQGYSQDLDRNRDTIYIRFNKNEDKIDSTKRVFKRVLYGLKNPNYTEFHKNDDQQAKFGPIPKYRSFLQTEDKIIVKQCIPKHINFYNPKNLTNSATYRKTIYLVIPVKDGYEFVKVEKLYDPERE